MKLGFLIKLSFLAVLIEREGKNCVDPEPMKFSYCWKKEQDDWNDCSYFLQFTFEIPNIFENKFQIKISVKILYKNVRPMCQKEI